MATETGDILMEAEDTLQEMKGQPVPERHFIDVRDSLPVEKRNDFVLNLIGILWAQMGDDFQDALDAAKDMTLKWSHVPEESYEPERLWNIFTGPRGIVYLTKVTARNHDEAIAKAKEKIQEAGLYAVPEC